MLDTLRLELRSDHAANAAVALRVLIKTPGDGAIEALGDFVARDLPRGPLWERLAARCVTALVERGPAGVEKLCSQLDRERSWSLPRMRVATRVAAALERYRCCGRVSESLRAWRRSPAGVAARMTSLVRRR